MSVPAFRKSTVAFAVLALPAAASALGILVPREVRFDAIRLGASEVTAVIDRNIAKTRVVQQFHNPNGQQLEADFYFPVPKGADVTDFVLYMGGKPVKGEVLEKAKAREIYEGIVRRMKDPGLLEWTDYNLFKVRVFPVPANGDQKIELEFAQPLSADQGTFKYTFPMRTPKGGAAASSGAVPEVKFTVAVKSDVDLRNITSPSHGIDVDSANPKSVKVTVPAKSFARATGDFTLFYEAGGKEIALSLVATRPESDEPGFFSLMLSPPAKADAAAPTPQDIVFVVDNSGSMSDDDKIGQARKALTYCVGQLRPDDRFALVRFSTDVDTWKPELRAATPDAVDSAKAWIKELRATGGTNISEGLHTALGMKPADGDRATSAAAGGAGGRVFTVVFITDGVPTVGQTDPDRIMERAKADMGAAANVRVFTFGVGNDVNAKLLDRLADDTRAAAEYVRPGQDMEAPVGKFMDKIARPAMTGLKLEMPGADVTDLYPKELPDLFHGTQLTVFGRYKAAGATAITLKGAIGGKPVEFSFEKTLPAKETENRFVETLWGTRKIAYLLDSIRRSGETAETKDEVVKLAKRYGVVTPYTSYLVTEDTPVASPIVAQAPMPTRPRPVPFRDRRFNATGRGDSQPMAASAPGAPPMSWQFGEGDAASVPAAAAGARPSESMTQDSGAGAVRMSKRIAAMKSAGGPAGRSEKLDKDVSDDQDTAGLRTIEGRTFALTAGVWTDSAIAAGDNSPVVKIKALSDAYFEAIRLNPALKAAFALGDRVRVKVGGTIVETGPEGSDMLTEADRSALRKS